MVIYPVIIIGGGASGSLAAALIPSALLLERMDKCCKKLLITGGGACNLTSNDDVKILVNKYYEKKSFVSYALYEAGPKKIISYFNENNVECYTRSDNKIFPLSNDSHDVANAIIKKIKNIHLNEEVVDIRKVDDHFIIKSTKDEYEARIVIVATGGASYPKTGSDGSFFKLLKALGHRIIPLKAALSELKTSSINTQAIEGVSLDNVTITHNGKRYEGPLLFTRRGLSGPMIMNLSHYIQNSDEITICFKQITKDNIKSQKGSLKTLNAIKALTSLPKSLIEYLIPSHEKDVASLNKDDLNTIVSRLTALKLTVSLDNLSFATVTQGGVDTKEIDNKTFESKLCKNLYIIGEATDVDGMCGGYNLTYAFSSAFCAAKAINDKLSKPL